MIKVLMYGNHPCNRGGITSVRKRNDIVMIEHEKKPIRVLQVLGTLGLGGAETMIMNVYQRLPTDRIEFDFLVNGDSIGFYENMIPSIRSRIYHVRKKSESFIEHYYQLFKVIRLNKYKVVHIHTQNAFLSCLQIIVFRLAGVKKVIAHSHNTMDWRAARFVFLSKIFRPLLYILTTTRLACGSDAAKWLFGTTDKVEIVPLPVDCAKYNYSEDTYKELRRYYGWENKKIIVHVGRFSRVKRQDFVLSVFCQLIKKDPEFLLFYVGDGELKSVLEKKVLDLQLMEKVIFWGNINDVYTKMLMADYFILPSEYEGFPTAAIEAQAAGLKSFLSDAITDKIAVTNLVTFLPLRDNAHDWSNAILQCNTASIEEKKKANIEIAQKYDVTMVVKRFVEIYEE